jgi:hypothetical protein
MNIKETEPTSDITYYLDFKPKYIGFIADTPEHPNEFLFKGSQIYENGFDYNSLVVICKNTDATEGVQMVNRVKDLSNEFLSLLSLVKKTAYVRITSITNTITVKIETVY